MSYFSYGGGSMSNIQDVVKELSRDLQQQTENLLLEQLGDLINRGLLVVETTQPILVHDHYSNKVEIKQAVKLTFKDKEYIQKLEVENAKYKDILSKIQELFPGFDYES